MKVYIVTLKGSVVAVFGTYSKAVGFVIEMEEYGNFGSITEHTVG